ncbi:hypothetical protein JZ751_005946 [Albula glossodonta]|uniref:Uncharacterized protein n=1 Tax=Albula glossodonta TaxID=121402 RepID=A0A8T2P3Z3_9TELE|nr:hypothetical protein JZ751_005946 [Albula glossodonta]
MGVVFFGVFSPHTEMSRRNRTIEQKGFFFPTRNFTPAVQLLFIEILLFLAEGGFSAHSSWVTKSSPEY